ncbi:hypothetical protein KEM55_008030 [Ascosphaera atra]|nr:hypothetical protein KEM55_008030 [Ascosphaera atra]
MTCRKSSPIEGQPEDEKDSISGSCLGYGRTQYPDRDLQLDMADHKDSEHIQDVHLRRKSRQGYRKNPSYMLPPCPRAEPTRADGEWYTFKHHDGFFICPSCSEHIDHTHFADRIVRKAPIRGFNAQCSFSKMWTRLAWVQTMQKGLPNLNLVYRVTDYQNSAYGSCPGPKPKSGSWYQLVNPIEGNSFPGLDICPACFASLGALFPEVWTYFDKDQAGVPEIHICDLHDESPQLVKIMDLLGEGSRRHGTRRLDVSGLYDYARQKANLSQCPRDHPKKGALWHSIHTLPEFTICPSCYNEVVLPLKGTTFLADWVHSEPVTRKGEHTCQLHSPQMRQTFGYAAYDHTDGLSIIEKEVKSRIGREKYYYQRQKLRDEQSRHSNRPFRMTDGYDK